MPHRLLPFATRVPQYLSHRARVLTSHNTPQHFKVQLIGWRLRTRGRYNWATLISSRPFLVLVGARAHWPGYDSREINVSLRIPFTRRAGFEIYSIVYSRKYYFMTGRARRATSTHAAHKISRASRLGHASTTPTDGNQKYSWSYRSST
jgi:hypothetical protein